MDHNGPQQTIMNRGNDREYGINDKWTATITTEKNKQTEMLKRAKSNEMKNEQRRRQQKRMRTSLLLVFYIVICHYNLL